MQRAREIQGRRAAIGAAALLGLAACSDEIRAPTEPLGLERSGETTIRCDPGNGGITLPPGFCATVFADLEGAPRHMAVAENGAVFVALNPGEPGDPVGVVGLRDTDGDGHADVQTSFGTLGGNGIALYKDWLYFAPNDRIERYGIDLETLLPTSGPELVVGGLPDTGDHVSKTLAIDDELGRMYVNIGSASNSCQVENRVLHSPGQDPCPELPIRAGIWLFNAEVTGQTQAGGERFARGFRNMVALALRGGSGVLYGVQHGRDDLNVNWPELFTEQEQADLPSEEFVRIDRGDDNGWPFCMHDWQQGKKVKAPEYGGDGEIVGGCDRKEQPIMTFPGHWAPNALLFYTATHFPARYQRGAFIAFHGSHDRAPLPQQGYNVIFVPFREGLPNGEHEVFADGFTGGGSPLPQNAVHRPTGLAQGKDGSLFISDDAGGRIWRVVFAGSP